jgi:hypothetical protein
MLGFPRAIEFFVKDEKGLGTRIGGNTHLEEEAWEYPQQSLLALTASLRFEMILRMIVQDESLIPFSGYQKVYKRKILLEQQTQRT